MKNDHGSKYHITPHRRYELKTLTSLPMRGLIPQMVEHRTGIMEVTGSNPIQALIFFRLLLSNCLNWKITAMIILHFGITTFFFGGIKIFIAEKSATFM